MNLEDFRGLPYTAAKPELTKQTCNLGHLHRQQRTRLTRGMLTLLRLLAQRGDAEGWVKLKDLTERDLLKPAEYTDGCKTIRWALAERKGRQSGVWRLTDLGRAFLLNALAVPMYVVTDANQVIGYHGIWLTRAELEQRGDVYLQQVDDITGSRDLTAHG